MACRAHLNMQILAQRGTQLESVAATARYTNLIILGMYAFFHGCKTDWKVVYCNSMEPIGATDYPVVDRVAPQILS